MKIEGAYCYKEGDNEYYVIACRDWLGLRSKYMAYETTVDGEYLDPLFADLFSWELKFRTIEEVSKAIEWLKLDKKNRIFLKSWQNKFYTSPNSEKIYGFKTKNTYGKTQWVGHATIEEAKKAYEKYKNVKIEPKIKKYFYPIQ